MAEEEPIVEPTVEPVAEPVEPAVDYSWAPEPFVKDGALDTEGFRAKYDELAAFKAQEDERLAGLPTLEDLEVRIPEITPPEGVEMPEGFELQVDTDDPELGALKQMAVDLGIGQEGLDKIMQIEGVRQLRAHNERMKVMKEEVQKLGPDAQSRLDTVKRTLEGRLGDLGAAVAESVTSADALRGIEKLLGPQKPSTQTPGGPPDLSKMSIDERLNLGARMRDQRKRA